MNPDYELDPRPIIWTGEPNRALEIDRYCRNSALLPRWQYDPRLHKEARVLVEPEDGNLTQAAEWVIVPIGASISRLRPTDQDSPLRLSA